MSESPSERKPNLYQDFPAEFLEEVWDGCSHRDCLPRCNTLKGHCERLKIEYEQWLSGVSTMGLTETTRDPDGCEGW